MIKYLLLLMLTLTACTSETRYGTCIGAFEDKDPNLNYEISGWNLFLGFMFSETLIVPGVVIFSELKCPVSIKAK